MNPRYWMIGLGLAALAGAGIARSADEPLPIVDVHMHYSESAWEPYPVAKVLKKMDAANVPRALVSSSPDEGTLKLHAAAPDRFIAFLRPYRSGIGLQNWMRDASVPAFFRERLDRGIHRGIGEIHIHTTGDVDLDVVRQSAKMAVARDLFLFIHADASVIEKILAAEPKAKILWAHAGLVDPPATVARMLSAHKNLWTEISIREGAIAPGGALDPDWRTLFLAHPDRIMIGSDTYMNFRWADYEAIIRHDRSWLRQLPAEIARKIAHENAERVLGR